MARTYSYADLMNTISRNTSRSADEDLQATVANLATNLIWQMYDWRESLVPLPPFYLVPNEQDHGSPFAAIPADFMGLRQAYFVQISANPVFRKDLTVIKGNLSLTHVRYIPHAISYEPTKNCFRLFPRNPTSIGAADYLVDGEYKKRPVKITPTNLATTLLPFDDIYFQTFIEAAQWAAWSLAKDPRAGAVQYVKGRRPMYSGQFALAMEHINTMASNEGLELGDPIISPSEPLVGPSYNQIGTIWQP